MTSIWDHVTVNQVMVHSPTTRGVATITNLKLNFKNHVEKYVLIPLTVTRHLEMVCIQPYWGLGELQDGGGFADQDYLKAHH